MKQAFKRNLNESIWLKKHLIFYIQSRFVLVDYELFELFINEGSRVEKIQISESTTYDLRRAFSQVV